MTGRRLNERYATWSRQIIAAHPQTCVRISNEHGVQGWFLAEPSARGLHLTLAMLHRDAAVSGMLLYHKALLGFKGRGATLGWAAFSVRNMPVMNIYAGLGAHFTATSGCWMWLSPLLSQQRVQA
jgi:hypothetical protein